jgi:predicted amidohydrolase
LTNAINPAVPPNVWRSHLISRAAENQRYVLSANVAHARQHCPTMIVAPTGETLSEAVPAQTTLLRATLDLGKNTDWYLSQCRTDVIALAYKK